MTPNRRDGERIGRERMAKEQEDRRRMGEGGGGYGSLDRATGLSHVGFVN